MSTDRDTTRIVRSWLEEGVTALPDRVLDAVLDQLPATPQRRATAWPARRFSKMNTTAKLSLAAATVAVAAFLGMRFLAPGASVGGPTETPTPTATPAPSVAAVAFPQPAALEPGTYFWDMETEPPVRFSFTVPAGWTNRSDIIRKDKGEPGEVALGLWIVTNTYADPCRWQDSLVDPAIGPTVEDLTTALISQSGRNASAATDVVVDGCPARRIELSVPADLDIATCDNGYYRDWLQEGESHLENPDLDSVDATNVLFRSGQVNGVYILDVEGVRIVINTWHMPASSEADLEELQRMLDTIQIEPPA
ncbi:hypothetical protein BH24CHL10_BH24CHL10_00710 [soil metagenome]